MKIYPQRAANRPEAAPSPPAALPSVWMAEPDPPWRTALLERFDAIDLSEMDDVALLHRTDTKFLLSEEQVFQALTRLIDRYRILETNGRRLQRYRTLYFDTQNLALYRQHHDGKRNR
ncbi:MAG: VTC domain-containing protein [Anaerolineae bacterium]